MDNPFVIDEEQRAILATVRRFVDEVVAPVAAELDRRDEPAACFSWDIVEKADAAGIRTMTLAEEHGGIGAGSLTTAMVIEELAKGDMGVAVVMAQTLKLAQILQTATSEDQRRRYLPKFRDDPRAVLAIGITEPETASNYFVPHRVPDAPFHTRAEKTDGGWKINGMKHFISNGNVASLYLLFAQTEKGKGLAEGATCFLVPRDTPGFTIGRVHDKMGERLANNAELIFQDCFVPDEDVVGAVGNGFQVLVDFFPASNAYAAATVLGVAVAAYERAVEWAKTRNQGGKLLIEHDGIATDLAECHMLLDVARTYIHRAAWAADNRELGWDPTFGSLPKVFASQAAWKIVTCCSEIHGGSGFMRDIGYEKLIRDAAAFLHSDGVNRTLLLKAAKHMF
ncbi:MAG: acyl-CoA dehydrogenase family protein [Rhodospirillales bacterium]|nr:MAG: acyl-CoA dehydrogenase family protein [Rhodospirillales bacterium]